MSTPIKDGVEFLVNTSSTSRQFAPALVGLTTGCFVAAWTDPISSPDDPSPSAVRAQLFTADGNKKGEEFLVNTTTTSDQFHPSITALADGRFVVAWTDSSGSPDDTFGTAVRGQIFTADGSKEGEEFLVNTAINRFQFEPKITALTDGRFVVVWTDTSGSPGDTFGAAVRGQIFNADGSRSGQEFLVNTTITSDQFEPRITALSDGRFVVAWTDINNNDPVTTLPLVVRGQIFAADGSKAGAEFQVSRSSSDQFSAAITALPDGRFLVAWTDDRQKGVDTSSYGLRGQIFAADGNKTGSIIILNTIIKNQQSAATSTMLPDGTFVVAWNDSSASLDDPLGVAVRAQYFAADGSKLGEEFLINSTTRGDQSQPTTTTLADGRFVVAWNDDTTSGNGISALSVRAQIFDGRTAALRLSGTLGSDDFVGTAFGDRITGLTGNDRLTGRGGNDRLLGSSGNDQLWGDDGNDLLDAGKGKDTLSGGTGRDTLTGGAGGDRFRYSTAAEAGLNAGRDVITDFRSGSDKLDLRSIDANTRRARDQSFRFIGTGAFTSAGQIRYQKSTGLLSADTNGDRLADFQLQLSNKPTLLATDLLL